MHWIVALRRPVEGSAGFRRSSIGEQRVAVEFVSTRSGERGREQEHAIGAERSASDSASMGFERPLGTTLAAKPRDRRGAFRAARRAEGRVASERDGAVPPGSRSR
jgi:hypothetical protein